MRRSIALPQTGPIAGRHAVAEIATLAEDAGLDGVWVLDRLLAPVAPRNPYPVRPDGALPAEFRRVLDPLATLTFVAARTERLGLGTSVLATPWYRPMTLARQLAAIDVFSAGRLKVGLGTGWSSDENQAAGADAGERGARTDDFVTTMIEAWTADVVAVDSAYTRVPASYVDLKPVQRPHPPLYFAAYAPVSMARTARFGAGWHPAGVPIDHLPGMMADIRSMAAACGRDGGALELVVRGNVTLTEDEQGDDRPDFTGTMAQVLADVERCAAIGATEVLLDPQFSTAAGSLAAYAEFTAAFAAARPAPALVGAMA
jgi:probable F420-dependent oxidoreductase